MAAIRAEEVLAVLHHGGGGVLLGQVRAAGYRLRSPTGYGLVRPSAPLQGYSPVLFAPQDRHGLFYGPVERPHFVCVARVVLRDPVVEAFWPSAPSQGAT